MKFAKKPRGQLGFCKLVKLAMVKLELNWVTSKHSTFQALFDSDGGLLHPGLAPFYFGPEGFQFLGYC
jgi:hypothetical protein